MADKVSMALAELVRKAEADVTWTRFRAHPLNTRNTFRGSNTVHPIR